MTLTRATIAAIVVVCGLSLSAGSPAQASSYEYNVAVEQGAFESPQFAISRVTSFAQAAFQAEGDKIWVWDQKADGMSAGVHWQTTGGRKGICRDSSGAAGGVDWRKCDKNFPEEDAIRIRLGRCDGDTSDCTLPSGYQDWSSWSAWTSAGGA